ncbi:MAG TPA: N,N-dimethylformamidase beta subunit family domain-containing protein [Candidatus Acidoferrum sp.]|jgi:hypothetical protein|nr:N,N-dimethylformamidase beta subunit family domain-containing protein [Candidatus Acidoferrum sp.]
MARVRLYVGCGTLWLVGAGALLGHQVVTNYADGGPGSLRQAILDASPGDTIGFDGQLGRQIVLTNGELSLGGNLTIVGPVAGASGRGGLTISGNNSNRIFHFLGGSNAVFNLTICSGHSGNAGGGILNEAQGSLTLSRCSVVTNSSDLAGGGIANYGNLTLDRCTFAGNASGLMGGGIYNLDALLGATNSTLTGNQSPWGGGIYNYGGLEILQNCTVALNLASSGGGGIASADNPPVFASNYLASTIIGGNTATNHPDLDGNFISLGYNLVGVYAGGGNFDPTNQDLLGTASNPLDARLGALQDNGGPTLTMALLPTSPAIDQGYAGALVTDQRGWPRKFDYLFILDPPGGDGSDIGAFELSPPRPVLRLSFSGGNVVLSWPTNAFRFRLQCCTALSPTGQWRDWTGPLVIMADQYVATRTNVADTRFFRLVAPFSGMTGLPANITTLPAAQVTLNSGVLQGSLVPGGSNCLCWFQYGTDAGYAQTTPAASVAAATNAVLVGSAISGLAPETVYHFRFVVGGGDAASFGNDLTFMTATQPAVTTLEATSISSNSAVLNGTVDPEGSPSLGWFVLFTINPPFKVVSGAQSLGGATNAADFSQPLTGLTPGETYYYYAAGSNSSGVSYGNRVAFTIPVSSTPITNVTTAENALPGTTDWKLTNPVTVGYGTNYGDREWPTLRTRAIEGYASATSVNKGDWLTFYVSTTSPSFSLEIFRMGYYGGLGGRRMPGGSWYNLPGVDQPTPPVRNSGLIECNWQPTYLTGATNGSFRVPPDWVSGVYVAKLTASSGKQGYIIFVVRDDARNSPYLVQSSVTTYQAYNEWGGKSFYFGVGSNSITVGALRALQISFNRPYMTSSHPGAAYGNGAGHFFTWEKLPGAVPQEPATWEYNMVRWLEAEGYDVTYCTDIDVERDSNLLRSHQGFLSVGHDEYWGGLARTNVERARDLGVNLGFFAGNTVWNRVRFDFDSQSNAFRTMAITGNFVVLRWYPESLVGGTWTGVSDSDLQVTPQCPPWLADGTGLFSGSDLGRLAGYEVNGFVSTTNENSAALVPPDTQVVFTSGAAKSIVYTAQASGATVFSAATVQWSWGLDAFTVDGVPPIIPPRSNRVRTATQQVTRNILRRFQDSTRMVVDLTNGEYRIQSASAYPSWLMCDNQGASNGPVTLSPGQGWTTTNDQAVWIITQYTGDRLPCAGPYKAAPDQWYTIRNKQNGQTLIVGDGGVSGGPVMVVGDLTGNWGAAPDNLQQMWRIWHYIGNNDQWYLFQNVASGQLLIVSKGSPSGVPVRVFGDNGGWGETEEDLQKMWVLTPH